LGLQISEKLLIVDTDCFWYIIFPNGLL
jgi:hypothetical protein